MIDRAGPVTYVEEPEDGEKLGDDSKVTVGISSYTGYIEYLALSCDNLKAPGEWEGEGTIRRVYEDLNGNGQWDLGEPFHWEFTKDGSEFIPDIPPVGQLSSSVG